MGETPRIFVSHSHADDAFCQRLISDLRAQLGEDAVWYDSSGGLHGGDEWWERIVAEVSARPYFLVVLSPNAEASKWVAQEMKLAWYLHVEQGKKLIPVRLAETPRRMDWGTIHEVDFSAYLDPQRYASALAEIWRTLGVTPSAPAPVSIGPAVTHAAPPMAPAATQPASMPAVAVATATAPQPDASRWSFIRALNFQNKTGQMATVAWSPDGTRVAGAIYDAYVWEAYSGNVLGMLSHQEGAPPYGEPNGAWRSSISDRMNGPACSIEVVGWSPNGALLATASADKTVRLWQMPSGTPVSSLPSEEGYPRCLAWSPDSTRLAVGTKEVVRIWDVAQGRVLFELREHRMNVMSACWSSDGTRLATGADALYVWDATNGAILGKLNADGVVRSLGWSPDGQRLIFGLSNGGITVCDMTRLKAVVTYSMHDALVNSVTWEPSGRSFATSSWDDTVHIWDAATLQVIDTLTGHTGPGADIRRDSQKGFNAAAWSPEGARLAAACNDGTVKIWGKQ